MVWGIVSIWRKLLLSWSLKVNKLPLLNWPADPLICTPYPIKPLIDPSSGMLVDLISCWIGWDRVDCGYWCRHRRLWKRALLTLNATFDQVLNLDKCHDPSSCIPYQTRSYDLMGSLIRPFPGMVAWMQTLACLLSIQLLTRWRVIPLKNTWHLTALRWSPLHSGSELKLCIMLMRKKLNFSESYI